MGEVEVLLVRLAQLELELGLAVERLERLHHQPVVLDRRQRAVHARQILDVDRRGRRRTLPAEQQEQRNEDHQRDPDDCELPGAEARTHCISSSFASQP
ncbi:MAG TPA: hypothetical protein VNO82_13445 [Solirubrobacteraceae bacterium]|nr:hypothetical protein [Solirubrobacteraceae bacterium]